MDFSFLFCNTNKCAVSKQQVCLSSERKPCSSSKIILEEKHFLFLLQTLEWRKEHPTTISILVVCSI